jgi:hypothetical protein
MTGGAGRMIACAEPVAAGLIVVSKGKISIIIGGV